MELVLRKSNLQMRLYSGATAHTRLVRQILSDLVRNRHRPVMAAPLAQ
jgi:hypothetical protein